MENLGKTKPTLILFNLIGKHKELNALQKILKLMQSLKLIRYIIQLELCNLGQGEGYILLSHCNFSPSTQMFFFLAERDKKLDYFFETFFIFANKTVLQSL